MRRTIPKVISVLLTTAILSSITVYAKPAEKKWTVEEIEKRIEEVGEEYIEFYRSGYNEPLDEESDWFSMNNLGFAAKSANGMMVQYDGAVEEAAEAEMVPIAPTMAPMAPEPSTQETFNTEEYASVDESGFIPVMTQPFSTFGADVDTASYSSLRRKLLEPLAYGGNPYYAGIDDSAIRIEELVNYFNYHYDGPEDGEKFGVTTALTDCPWNSDTLLLKIGIRAEEVKEESKGSNIVFLVDTSGSMFDFDKLPLVKKSLGILLESLDEHDRISIVTYAGGEEVIAEGVSGDKKEEILSDIDSLKAWGSTYGEGGINKAYEIAEKFFIKNGNNRVILCTDGDFNVGVSSEAGLKELISEKRESGVFFSCLGVGGGNYSDTTMEALADNGNGNYFYIDSEREAERALKTEFLSTIYTVAKDAKFQVEFNPAAVKGYRLIGYENRKMAAQDFADDKKDGGEVGAGQNVTVLYEVVPANSKMEITNISSKYQKEVEASDTEELLTVNIRYKEPNEDTSVLREYTVSMADKAEMDEDTSWAAGIAQAGMLMRDSEYAGDSTFDNIYRRLMFDPDVMDDDFKAEFLYVLKQMKNYKEGENAK